MPKQVKTYSVICIENGLLNAYGLPWRQAKDRIKDLRERGITRGRTFEIHKVIPRPKTLVKRYTD